MNKDIIYIDTEDDITAIIGKIKDSKEKIVALVPPKRTGILQSAVNLRLLARIADSKEKHLVIVTNNKALIALTAVAKIPVAKNLQSKPEIAEIAALEIDDGEDVIDGAQLPVGELASRTSDKAVDDIEPKTNDHFVISDKTAKESDIVEDMGTINIDDEGSRSFSRPTPQPINDNKSDTIKSGVKVPDFQSFRKKLFIGGGLGTLFIAFLVWAIWFSPSATVIVTATTDPAPVSLTLTLGGAAVETDATKGIIQTISKQIVRDVSVDFTATGQKDLGVKATGSITIRNCDYPSGFTLVSGTQFTTSGGKTFVSKAAVTVPGFTGLPSACTLAGNSSGKNTVEVEAVGSGESYNNSGVAYSISSIPTAAEVDAIGSAMTGGTTRMATVVSADDITKANAALIALSSESVKQELTAQFVNDEFVIADSFNVEHAAAVSAPLVDAESTDGKAKLTSSTTFTITAISKSELQAYVKAIMSKQITDTTKQRIYDDGIDKIVVSGYLKKDATTSTVNVATTGRIGPNIDQAALKELVKGKRYGDAQSLIESISGVTSADIKFPYVWVRKIPTDVNKIEIQFNVENA